MSIRICASQLLEDLSIGRLLAKVDIDCYQKSAIYKIPLPYLFIWSGGEHPLLKRMSRVVKWIGDHQIPSVEAGRLNERQRPDPLHHCVSLWCHLQ